MPVSAKLHIGSKKILNWIQLCFVCLVLAACANPVAPTGGPRDTDPPVILHSDPENGSVNFDAREIRIWFDEFIQLRGLSQKFLSSPPFKKVPETRIRGKSLIIRFEEELRPNTTYTLFFGDAIADFNEGNSIPNFRYIFSTGPMLDSMELSGKLVNAFTLKPEKEVFVMLYDIYEDSITLQERPYYISRTNEEGQFHFTNLRNIPYKIFALRDVNANLIYDMPNEEIAFIDSLVHPVAPIIKPARDSIQAGDINGDERVPEKDEHEHGEPENDELRDNYTDEQHQTTDDSLEKVKKDQAFTLHLFNEVDSTQRLEKLEYLHPNKLQFVFRFPVKNLKIEAIPAFDQPWRIPEMSSKADTLWYWLLDVERDTLKLAISAGKMETDTLRRPLTRFQEYRKQKQTDTIVVRLDVRSNLPRTGPADLHKPIEFTFFEPIASVNTERIELLEDSVRIFPEIKFRDEAQRFLLIEHTWKDTTNYDLLIPDSVFLSIYGHYNDTLQRSFRTGMRSDYGNIRLNLEHGFTSGQFIVELSDDRGRKLQQKIAALDCQQLSFLFLMPGKYQVKLIHDANSNGRWDTGIYLEGRQSERVYMFEKTMELRANWDIEETFIIPE
jgi:hypothetical protein